MKKLLLIFLFIANSLLASPKLPFKMERLNTDFSGVVYFNNTIFAYGDNGVILSSKDFGTNWNKYTLNENENINQLIMFQEKLIGISNNKLIELEKEKDTWKSTSLQDTSSIIHIEKYNTSIILMFKNKINVYDSEFNLLEEDIIKESSDFLNLYADKDYLFVTLKDLTLIKYNFATKNIIKINLSEKLNCTSCNLYDFKIKDSMFVVNTSLGIFLSKDSGNTFSQLTNTNGTFDIYNNEIYEIEGLPFNILSKTVSYIIFNKLSNEQKTKISQTELDSLRQIFSYSFKDFEFVTKDTLIGVGSNNLISISYNGGKNWKILSYLNSLPFVLVKVSKLYCVSDSLIYILEDDFTVFKSTNLGLTWLPQFMTDKKVYSVNYDSPFYYQNNIYFDKFGNGLIINNNYFVRDTSKGKININYMLTHDFGVTYKYGYDKNLDNIGSIGNHILECDTSICTVSTGLFKLQGVDTTTTYISQFYFDKQYNLKNKNVTFGKLILKIISDENKNKYLLIKEKSELNLYQFEKSSSNLNLIGNGYGFLDNSHIYGHTIISNSDGSKSLIYYSDYYSGGTVYDVASKTFSTTPSILNDTLFSINLTTNLKTILLVNTDTLSSFRSTGYGASFFKNNDKYYQSCLNGLFERNNLKNSLWAKIELNRYSLLNFLYTNNNLFCYNYASYGKEYQSGYYRINNSNNNTSIESHAEDQTYFYSYPPYPIPALNEVKSLIYWDMSFDIDASEINVFDVFGNKVDNKSNIKINKLNSYSGYLTWDCSKATSGVYMIQLKHGNKTNNISVMVVR